MTTSDLQDAWEELAELEAIVSTGYTVLEAVRLVHVCDEALEEVMRLVDRAPTVARSFIRRYRERVDEHLAKRTGAALSGAAPETRQAVSWLLEVLSREPSQEPRCRTQLQVIRGGAPASCVP